MEVVKNPKNVKVQQNTEEKNAQNDFVKNQQVENAKKQLNEVLHPTVESRLKKLETFKLLAEKHKFLSGKNDDLQKFIASSDGMKEKAVLKNSQGFEFEISNSSVISKVIDVIQSELQTITTASEKQVLEFSI